MINKLHLIKSDKKILDALRKLDKLKIKILFVVNEKNNLIGSLSEGDIRRSFIKGKTINNLILPITNLKPNKINEEELKNNLKIKKQLCYPIVNKNNKVIDVVYFEDLDSNSSKLDNAFFIFAGGKGERLLPITKEIPKPLVEIDGKPILQILLEEIEKQNFKNIYLSLNFKKEMIIKQIKKRNYKSLNINFINEKKFLGTAGSIGHLKEKLKKPFFIMNADLIYRINYRRIIDFFWEKKTDFVIVCHYHNYILPYGEIKKVKTKLISISEKPKKEYLVASGIYLASPKIQKIVKFNKYLDMPNLINNLQKKGFSINILIHNNYLQDISDVKKLDEVNLDFEL